MNSLQKLTLLVLLAWGTDALATLAITGDVVIEPHPSVLLRGQQATITYTLTNTGDEPLDAASSGFDYRTFGPLSTLFPFPLAATPPCGFSLVDFSTPPGVPGFVVNTNTFQPRPIEPGETRQCVTGLQVSAETAGPFVHRFGFSGVRDGRNVFTAQFVTFTLGEPPLLVPAVSPWGLALLSILMLTLASYRRLREWTFGNRS